MTYPTECAFACTNFIDVPSPSSPRMLLNNIVPSPSEMSLIPPSQTLCDQAPLDAEIDRLRPLHETSQTLEAICASVDEHAKPIPSPVRQMPPELLGKIISQCLPHDRAYCFPEYKLQLIRITHVCRQWRLLCLTTSHLWSHLLFDPRRDHNLQLELVQAWLHRSAVTPISFHMSVGNAANSGTQSFLAIISLHCSRWKSANFSSMWSGLWISGIKIIKGNLSQLEFLSLPDPISSCKDIFAIAPKLHSLYISEPENLQQIQLPWGQLTHCHIKFLDGEVCLSILRQMLNITSFKTHLVSFHNVTSLPNHDFICLAHLRTLDIAMDSGFGHFYNHLVLPSLCDLKCRSGSMDSSDYVHLLALLSRSSTACPLTKLTFKVDHHLPENFIPILQATPQLVELSLQLFCLYIPTAAGKLFAVLTVSANNLLVPKLRTIVYDTYSGFSDQSFAEMVESRWRVSGPTISQLQSVSLVSIRSQFGEYHGFTLGRLKEFAAEGLSVHIRTGIWTVDEPSIF